MTTADPSIAKTPLVPEAAGGESWWARIERLLERAGERLNPILVKEARQAMKSRQFVTTFSLMLICGWGWSLLGIALSSPGVFYLPVGTFILGGYYFVLAVPLLLVVPFAAFRSLASEREDGTFELITISTLEARQIVSGKLGSAILQMLVYYSAMSPCIAFTYLLRGVDIFTIGFLLVYTFLVSLMLSVLGLLVATLSQSRHWQIFLSVLLLLGLLWTGVIWSMMMMGLLTEPMPYDQVDFWFANLFMVMLHFSFFVLCLFAAAGQISFASDNRSTRLRAIMLVQQVLWIGWMIFFWAHYEEYGFLVVLVIFLGIYWAFMGSLLIGEGAELSPRVKRGLPQSFLGRMTLTWLNPGSGTGYIFATLNLLAGFLVVYVSGQVALMFGWITGFGDIYWATIGLLVVLYVTIYLGVVRLIFLAMRRVIYVGISFTLLATALLAAAGAAIPYFLSIWIVGFQEPEFNSLQLTNWVWTIYEAGENGLVGGHMELIVLAVFAVSIFLVNLMLAFREVEQVRSETPRRVLDDEAERHPERRKARPASPWDEDEDQQSKLATG